MNRVRNVFLNTVIAYETAIVAFWAVPYSYVLKQKLLRILAQDTTSHLNGMQKVTVAPVLMHIFLSSLLRPRTADLAAEIKRQSLFYRSSIGLLLMVVVNRANYLLRDNVDGLIQLEQSAIDRDMLNFTPPSHTTMASLMNFYRPLFRPIFLGLENIPTTRPLVRGGPGH